MKTIKFIVIAILFCNALQAQFPISKNLKIGEKELKSFLSQKGYHFLKETELKKWFDSDTKNYKCYSYSEEFDITFWTNYYENITDINFSTKKRKLYDDLLIKFNSKSWTLIDTKFVTDYGIEKKNEFFSYKSYNIECVTQDNLYQFIIKSKD